jgi:integrase
MKGTLGDASSKTYMKKFKYYLEQLVNADLFLQSPARHIKVGAGKSKGKDFINREQLEILENHPTEWEVVKRYYLFASYSAITMAECIKMKFGDFDQDDNGQWYANVVRQKSQKPARLKMGDKAMSFILPMGNPNDRVFPNLKAGSNFNKYLLEWVEDAGIDKHLTPHTAKNNYAVMFWRKNQGKYIDELMAFLQHDNIESTIRYLKKMLSTEYSTSNANIDF